MIFSSPTLTGILLSLGPVTIRYYGLMIAMGALAAITTATAMAAKRGLDDQKLVNCALSSFVGSIIGARLYYVALQWQNYVNNLPDIVATWHGGMSLHGGIIGAFIGCIIYCKLTKSKFWPFCDVITTSVPLAQSIGRWGNFFNSEAFGKPVGPDFPLKLYIPPDRRPSQFHQDSYFHPTFLYEAVWDLALFLLLYFVLAEQLKKYDGMAFSVYITIYSIGRLLIEPIRSDSIMAGTIPFPMIASAVGLAIGVVGIIISYMKGRKNEGAQAES
ncbi:MAG: prolipoprotein diacylglyceryl transferase [Candidatus Obscuribacterales bacterium]|nr:prolipoprotein diacylglyceryl transferase [Cyanobacteria bacterium SZAS LIN-5]RTL40799.1 MAG: prolipoprotein diacylglyceryl transferase [Candidatus Melainabacteria bacterium]